MVGNYKAKRPKLPAEALASAEQLLEHYLYGIESNNFYS
jgi:hypothetical protein